VAGDGQCYIIQAGGVPRVPYNVTWGRGCYKVAFLLYNMRTAPYGCFGVYGDVEWNNNQGDPK